MRKMRREQDGWVEEAVGLPGYAVVVRLRVQARRSPHVAAVPVGFLADSNRGAALHTARGHVLGHPEDSKAGSLSARAK